MGIDVLNLIEIEPGITYGVCHAARGPGTVCRRRGHMVGITTHTKANQFGINVRTTSLGMLQFF